MYILSINIKPLPVDIHVHTGSIHQNNNYKFNVSDSGEEGAYQSQTGLQVAIYYGKTKNINLIAFSIFQLLLITWFICCASCFRS